MGIRISISDSPVINNEAVTVADNSSIQEFYTLLSTESGEIVYSESNELLIFECEIGIPVLEDAVIPLYTAILLTENNKEICSENNELIIL